MQTTVYLLDDEPDLLELLSSVVGDLGFRSRCFEKASHFFNHHTEFTQDSILVLDLNMPEMDGIEVMRKLANMVNSPKVILMSGEDSSVLRSAEKLGFAHELDILGSIGKPINISQLQSILTSNTNAVTRVGNANPSILDDDLNIHELREAIFAGEMVLHYQPQFHLETGQMVGVEALVRWNHPVKGMIPPLRFISKAERSGVIRHLTRWVVEQALAQQKVWKQNNLDIGVSVNISAVDITSLTLPEQLVDLAVDSSKFTLEMTESTLMGQLVTSLDVLTRFRLKGLELSIDDFGTGYSSFSQLHRAPFTEIKIDKSFVSNMHKDEDAKTIVKTCILLGHELEMKVVAEGVESEEQFALLKDYGCDIGQGFLFSKPVTSDMIEAIYHKVY
mgnify:CR=1 FL=1